MKKRKIDHIDLCLNHDVDSKLTTGFEKVHLLPMSVPCCDFSQISTTVTFLNHTLAAPIMISGMSGGVKESFELNRRLAQLAQRYNIALGVGSQRIALEKGASDVSLASFKIVRQQAPRAFIVANIGFAQIAQSYALDYACRAVDMIEANALAIHVNAVQELIQDEGDHCFSRFFKHLEDVCHQLKVPVILKEVGYGLDLDTVRRARQSGVAAVDCAGAGGTAWGYIESLRSERIETKRLGESFRSWGIGTAYNLAAIKNHEPNLPVIASGGIRDGLTVAKACALGASLVGIARPFLQAAMTSEEALEKIWSGYMYELKMAMCCVGAASLDKLAQRVVYGESIYADELAQRLQHDGTHETQ